jgi:hypothetical protein
LDVTRSKLLMLDSGRTSINSMRLKPLFAFVLR